MANEATRTRYYRDPPRVEIFGTVDDTPYGVSIDLDSKHATWLENPEPRKPRKGQDEDCPGCHKSLKKLITGALGFTKRALGVDACPPEIVEDRIHICETCPSDCYHFGVCRDDWPDRPKDQQGCGCILPIKVQLASEQCPHAHWPAIEKK